MTQTLVDYFFKIRIRIKILLKIILHFKYTVRIHRLLLLLFLLLQLCHRVSSQHWSQTDRYTDSSLNA